MQIRLMDMFVAVKLAIQADTAKLVSTTYDIH